MHCQGGLFKMTNSYIFDILKKLLHIFKVFFVVWYGFKNVNSYKFDILKIHPKKYNVGGGFLKCQNLPFVWFGFKNVKCYKFDIIKFVLEKYIVGGDFLKSQNLNFFTLWKCYFIFLKFPLFYGLDLKMWKVTNLIF